MPVDLSEYQPEDKTLKVLLFEIPIETKPYLLNIPTYFFLDGITKVFWIKFLFNSYFNLMLIMSLLISFL